MATALNYAIRSGLEGFVNPEDAVSKKEAYVGLAAGLITFVIVLAILSLVGKLLWNGVIVELFSFAKPARSIMQILGLYIFSSLLMC